MPQNSASGEIDKAPILPWATSSQVPSSARTMAASSRRVGARRWRNASQTAIVDGAVNGTGAGTAKTGEALTKLQSGKVRAYALIMATGMLIAAFFAVLGGK